MPSETSGSVQADETDLSLPAGVYGALATPLDASRNLDHAGLDRLVLRMVRGGVAGISPVGSTGEGPRLTAMQRLTVVARVCRSVPKPMPVIAGVPVTSVAEAIAELDRAAWAGATAALVSPPPYFALNDADLIRLYEQLANGSPIPLLLYNIPVFTKTVISPEVVARLAEHPKIVGIKESSGELAYLRELVKATASKPRFRVLTGADRLLVPSLEAGAHGTIAASLNLAPYLAVGVYRDYLAGDHESAAAAQATLTRLVETCRVGPFPAGWKSALHYAGLCEPFPAFPASPLHGEERRDLWKNLSDLGIEQTPPGAEEASESAEHGSEPTSEQEIEPEVEQRVAW